MTAHTSTRSFAAALIAGLSLMLTGCFITPGKFTSELVLTTDNRFTFTYEGEIFFLGLSNLAEMGAAAEDEFVADECYDEETFADRECTEQELNEQREVWDMNAPVRAAQAQEQAQQMSAMMGGIDPSDPASSAELVEMLERQRGWERVVDKGDGVFDVLYTVEGELSHDFMFPVIEGFPTANPFVQMIMRDGNVVRVNAPGFGAPNESNPLTGMMGGLGGLGPMAMLANAAPGESEELPKLPVAEGTFTLTTNGQIKANNTDEGSVQTGQGEQLVWTISPRTKSAPTALIDLTP